VVNNFNITNNYQQKKNTGNFGSVIEVQEVESDKRRDQQSIGKTKDGNPSQLRFSNIPERKSSAHSAFRHKDFSKSNESGMSLNLQDESQLDDVKYLPEYGICKDDLLQFLNLQATFIEEEVQD